MLMILALTTVPVFIDAGHHIDQGGRRNRLGVVTTQAPRTIGALFAR
jgi:hypothetical protein